MVCPMRFRDREDALPGRDGSLYWATTVWRKIEPSNIHEGSQSAMVILTISDENLSWAKLLNETLV